MDIGYLYTNKQDGFDRYVMTSLDDHSRTVIASGLYERQTVAEVVAVLKAAVLTYGVPRQPVYWQCISSRLCGDPIGRG